MFDQAVLFPKCFSHRGIISETGQLDHSYTFWTKYGCKFWATPSKNFERFTLSWIYQKNFYSSKSNFNLHNFLLISFNSNKICINIQLCLISVIIAAGIRHKYGVRVTNSTQIFSNKCLLKRPCWTKECSCISAQWIRTKIDE